MRGGRSRGWRHRAAPVVGTLALLSSVLLVGAMPAGAQENPNACHQSADGRWSNIPISVSGSATAASPTRVDLTATSVAAAVPDHVLLELYALGYYTAGLNPIGLTMSVTIAATNTVEGQQTVGANSTRDVVITDPDGVKGTGDEAVSVSPPFTLPLPATGWTPTGGLVELRQVSATIATSHFFGSAVATLTCQPGSTPDRVTVVPATARPFASLLPPTPPSCTGTSLIGGPGQTIDVDLATLCVDPNGDLDPSSAVIVTAPTAGNAALSGGVLTYTNTITSASTDQITLSIGDAFGLTSGPFTIDIAVQPLRYLQQAASTILMPAVTLDGDALAAEGALNQISVTNLPPSGLGFSVSAYATDLTAPEVPLQPLDLDGDGVPDLSVPSCPTATRSCIPASNLAWSPSASVIIDDVPGGGATVDPGPALASGSATWLEALAGTGPTVGLDQPQLLCAASPTVGIGTFHCDADLYLGVPASTGAATYRGLLVLTIL